MAIAFSRSEWGGRDVVIPQDTVTKTELAVHHSDDENQPVSFWTIAREKEKMRAIETFHIEQRGWSAFAYSWAIFPTGRAYTGRGFTGLPAGQIGENSGTWAIVFVGNFESHEPTREARLKLQEFIERLEEYSDGKLKELGGHREFPHQSTQCPGDKLIEVVERNRERFNLQVPRN